MSSTERSAGSALAAVQTVVASELEADVVLRRSVETIHECIREADWVGLSFVEEGRLVLGPQAGDRPEPPVSQVHAAISYRGKAIGELAAASSRAAAFTTAHDELLVPIAEVLSDHCLVGWDTGGVPWDEVT